SISSRLVSPNGSGRPSSSRGRFGFGGASGFRGRLGFGAGTRSGTPRSYVPPADAGTSRVPVAFQVATTGTPGPSPRRAADSSVISATTCGLLPTVTRTRLPTAARRRTGPINVFSADPSGASLERATSHG